MKTVIMAGGKGTRISEMFPDIPKPLIHIDGVPVLEREIISLHNQGFDDIIITISHMGDKIKEYFEDGSKWNVNIQYFEEKRIYFYRWYSYSCTGDVGRNVSYK